MQEPKDQRNSSADDPEAQVRRLVDECRAGRTEAFDEIVFLYREEVLGAAWRLTRDRDDAFDVAQEVFLRAFRALKSFHGNARFSTWLHRILVNACIDYSRRERRHRQGRVEEESGSQRKAEDSDSHPALTDSRPSPPRQREQAYEKEINVHLLAALDTLSAQQRKAFILRYLHELPVREVAEILRCTEGTAKRHLFRAAARLREVMKEFKRR